VREIVAGASDLVIPGGWLMIELAAGRDRDTERLVDPSVWQLEPTRPDMQGIPRLLLARRAA
jgi:hypothetical protein